MRSKDPLRPVELILALLLGLMIAAVALFGIFAALGSGSHWSGFDEPCLSAEIGHGISHTVAQSSAQPDPELFLNGKGDPLPPTTRADVRTLRACAPHPTTSQRVWYALTVLPGQAVLIASMGLGLRAVRRGRRLGLFHPSVGRSVARLGAVLLVGDLLLSALGLVARTELLQSLSPGAQYGELGLPFSWGMALMGAVLMTLGRAISQAAMMREELDATV